LQSIFWKGTYGSSLTPPFSVNILVISTDIINVLHIKGGGMGEPWFPQKIEHEFNKLYLLKTSVL
jgi:hypothetical protein